MPFTLRRKALLRPLEHTRHETRVVIVGGGFAGLDATRYLAPAPLHITVVDQKNHHTFQPLLYQVALSVLSAGDIASALRHIFRAARNVETLLDEVIGFELDARKVQLRSGGELGYDYLIVCAGARHAYFGHDDWELDAPGLKTIEDAVDIRNRLLLAFERAERDALFAERRHPVTVAIVGGGPTGVELAGAVADLARLALARDFRHIDTAQTRVRLYEAAPRLLGMMSEASSRKATEQLSELGVEVLTGCGVTSVESGRIQVAGDWVPTDVIVWATGVAASPLGRRLRASTDRAGRVHVESDLSLAGRSEVFVIGDMAAVVDVDGRVVPGLAAAAKQQGRCAAAQILRDLNGEPRQPFRYRDHGLMATIGRHRAVAEIGRWKLSGVPAWLLWSIVHVFLLISFRSRLGVMRQWIWAYFTLQGSSPLITTPPKIASQRPEVKAIPIPLAGSQP